MTIWRNLKIVVNYSCFSTNDPRESLTRPTSHKGGLLQIVWMILHVSVAECLLGQSLLEFSSVGKLGVKRRWEDLGGSWRDAASLDFVRGCLAREHPLTEAQPHMSFLRHQGIYCVSPSSRLRNALAAWPGNCQTPPNENREQSCFSIVGQASLPVPLFLNLPLCPSKSQIDKNLPRDLEKTPKKIFSQLGCEFDFAVGFPQAPLRIESPHPSAWRCAWRWRGAHSLLRPLKRARPPQCARVPTPGSRR